MTDEVFGLGSIKCAAGNPAIALRLQSRPLVGRVAELGSLAVLPMRIPLILALMILSPVLARADVKWHKFGVSGNDKDTIAVGRVSVTIETREVRDADFREDNLVMRVHAPGQKESQHWFTSSYGMGAIAVHGNVLLLKYGAGRGTYVRVEHIKALRLDHALEEVVDVQSSYYILANPHNAAPDLLEYRVKIHSDRDYTTLSFSLPARHKGIPSEKIVRLRNDG